MNIPWWGEASPSTLRILFWFRTASIAGQIAAAVLAELVFSFPLNSLGIASVIVGLIVANLFTWRRSRHLDEAGNPEIFFQLLIDVSALTVLFYFSGGATNPFISMYLLPLAIGAVLLTQAWIWLLAVASVSAYSCLMWLYPSLHIHNGDRAFNLHVFGMWISFVLSAALIAFFVVKMRAALRQRDQQLARAQEQAIKDEKLASLGALAASTAHEMGTPLGTMQLMIADLEENKISREEIDILLEQVSRCKEALAEMSTSAGGLHVEGDGMTDFNDFITGLLAGWRQSNPGVALDSEIQGNAGAGGVFAAKTVSRALVNLLDNAAEASPESVRVSAGWQRDEARIIIANCGKDLDPAIIDDIGSKPFSTKPDGIGIGAFLAHEIIQRLGGTVKLINRPGGRLHTVITLPLK